MSDKYLDRAREVLGGRAFIIFNPNDEYPFGVGMLESQAGVNRVMGTGKTFQEALDAAHDVIMAIHV